MTSIFSNFQNAYSTGDGRLLASCIDGAFIMATPGLLRDFAQLTNYAHVSADIHYDLFEKSWATYKPSKDDADLWVDIFAALWRTAKEIVALEDSHPSASWEQIFNAYKEMVTLLIRGYSSGEFEAWTVPCLSVAGKALIDFAAKADTEVNSKRQDSFGNGLAEDIVADTSNERQETVASVLNRMFNICLTDRSDITQSRKWGIYSILNLSFKLYFRLNSVNLCRSLLRSLKASSDEIPALTLFPKSQYVTFMYYRGVLAFLEENYSEAEEHLTTAYDLCHKGATKNLELILTYLIPCHILTTHTLPSKVLLLPYPRLEALFRPLCTCIKNGDLSGFDAALIDGEHEFVKRRIYLTLERGRDIALRNLFRLVFLAGGLEESKDGQAPIRRTRIPLVEFMTAMRLGTKTENSSRLDLDEVECFTANLIYKNLMKGYISHERAIVVLNKKGAFPGTGV